MAKRNMRWKEFELAVEKLLKLNNCSYHRVSNYRCFNCGQVQNHSAAGFPDFFIYYPKVFAVEVKTGSAKLTPKQKEIKEKMQKSGIHYIELHDNVDELLEYLDEGDVQK